MLCWALRHTDVPIVLIEVLNIGLPTGTSPFNKLDLD